MKTLGAILVPPPESGHILFFVPLDGKKTEFVPFEAIPKEVQEDLLKLDADAESTVLGVIVEVA